MIALEVQQADGVTIGVEEEFFLIDPDSRRPQPVADAVIACATPNLGGNVGGEFTRYQIEVKTPPCEDASRLRAELAALRTAAAAAAAAEGVRLCASGTPVLAAYGPTAVGDHPRYRAGVGQYRAMLDDFMVCSLHVHIHVPDRELAVLAGNHLRPWLPLLIALSANSPFHQGHDTGYADWRAVIRSRFPCLGPPPYAESLRHHEELAITIAESGAMLNAATPFWDIRPNPHVPTLEVRCMDVNADLDDTVAVAMLVRALVAVAVDKAPETAGRVAASMRSTVGSDPPPYTPPGCSTTSNRHCVATTTATPCTSSWAGSPRGARAPTSSAPHWPRAAHWPAWSTIWSS
jgi:carboxylate-amine ligase